MMEKQNQTLYESWLASAELPAASIRTLFDEFKSAKAVFDTIIEKKTRLESIIPNEKYKILLQNSNRNQMEKMQSLLDKHLIFSLNYHDPDYPVKLRMISDPPYILFYQGNIKCMSEQHMIAMVGSRSASYSSLKASRTIARELSRSGICIISGMAYGIDSECHCGCVEGGSPSIAVMGCGLDLIYPEKNSRIKQDIIEHNGLMISEYAPGSKPFGYHFPVRNRIISGLSDAVILMEAKIRSGSMTTIDHALNQGKEIFVYPGDPVSPYSEGNRMLLRDGARYFTTADEIMEDMNWLDNLPYVRQNSDCSAKVYPETHLESVVFQALEKGMLSFEQILSITGLSSSELMSTITIMQIKQMIETLPGKKYQIKK